MHQQQVGTQQTGLSFGAVPAKVRTNASCIHGSLLFNNF
jgi:hypothetical protein